MESVSTLILSVALMTGVSSCQSQPFETVFESKKQDTATELNRPKIYKLKRHTTNSDFNHSKLKDIDGNIKDTVNIKNLMPIFEPVNGHFNYYQFLATFKGEGYNGGEAPIIKDFHDILILKTDKNNNIIDAFHYTLEWGEPPLQYDLFKSSVKGIMLTDSLDISKLKFIRTYNWSDDNKELKENGIIKLK